MLSLLKLPFISIMEKFAKQSNRHIIKRRYISMKKELNYSSFFNYFTYIFNDLLIPLLNNTLKP